MRGGTSKGLYFNSKDIPENYELRNFIFQRAMGSPDSFKKQINGLGGATSSTSKIMIAKKSQNPEIDCEY